MGSGSSKLSEFEEMELNASKLASSIEQFQADVGASNLIAATNFIKIGCLLNFKVIINSIFDRKLLNLNWAKNNSISVEIEM